MEKYHGGISWNIDSSGSYEAEIEVTFSCGVRTSYSVPGSTYTRGRRQSNVWFGDLDAGKAVYKHFDFWIRAMRTSRTMKVTN